MPCYYFEIADGTSRPDDEGVECASEEDVRREALRALPDIARHELGEVGGGRFLTVVARDETGTAVYSATLSLVGVWLNRRG